MHISTRSAGAVVAAALTVLLGVPACLMAAEPVVGEYELKSELLERLTRFVTWPEGALTEEASSPFVIGVVGRNPFGGELRRLVRERRVSGHPVELRELRDLEQVVDCHLLFIGSTESRRLPKILESLEGRPVLTVGDSPGFGESGVMINFFLEGGRVGFEINRSTAVAHGFDMSSKLLKLARIVETSDAENGP